MSEKSEKINLSHQEITRHLDENSHAVREQQEEMRRIQSGGSEKTSLTSMDHECSVISDPSKSNSISSGGASFLVTPPPSYFGNDHHSMPAVESLRSEKTEPSMSFERRSSTGNYRNLLIKDLRFETRRQLGLHLDLEHPNVKNWKNLADEIGFSNLEIQNFDNVPNKTQRVLNEAEVRYPEITVGDLCDLLKDIDRPDVLTDIEPLFAKDVSRPRRKFGATNSAGSSANYSFPTASSRMWNTEYSMPPSSFMHSQDVRPPPPFPTAGPRQESLTPTESLPSVMSITPVQDDSITTTGSTTSTERLPSVNENKFLPHSSPPPPQAQPISLPPDYDYPAPQRYDAFVLYDVADKNFILNEFLPKVETDAGLKLCIPGRDSPAGDHVYDGQLETMMTSCPKLIVIQSDEFLRSPASRWSLNIALALDPAARRRKIIPVVYKRVTEPSILAGINACDRTRVLEDSWFWDGIIRSLKQTR